MNYNIRQANGEGKRVSHSNIEVFMPHPKDEEIYPPETLVRMVRTGEMALVKDQTFLKDKRNFLNYLCIIEDRGESLYAVYHDDIELEA